MSKKREFDGLQSRTIFCFWTGDNPMSEARTASLKQMAEITGCTVQLITKDNLKDWEVEEDPIHLAYEFLSAVHRADYLRAYFMCHYGGGYSDVKKPTGSWKKAFDVLTRYETLWVVGYPEADEGCIACIDDKGLYKKMQSVYWRMVGNGSYVCRKGSPLVNEWLTQVHTLLDEKLPMLHAYPAPHPRAHSQEDPRYALQWTELCGHIFHPLVYTYIDHVAPILPPPDCTHYL
jgi:hypothetical protein